MYYDAVAKKRAEEAVAAHSPTVSLAVELTRSSAEVEAFERRHDSFIEQVLLTTATTATTATAATTATTATTTATATEEGRVVVATIQSIAKEHRRIGKRDFSDTTHYKRFRHTSDVKCINVRDDQVSKYPNGDTYDGQYLNTHTHTHTSTSTAGRDRVEEEHRQYSSGAQLKHGKGVYKYVNGDKYDGDWQFDKW
jgi:hypothetical protein